jgi:hypothetical protein
MIKEAYKQGRIRHSQQDESREFIFLLAYICANGTATAGSNILRRFKQPLKHLDRRSQEGR